MGLREFLIGFTGFYWAETVFCQVKLDFKKRSSEFLLSFNRFLLGLTRWCRVLLCSNWIKRRNSPNSALSLLFRPLTEKLIDDFIATRRISIPLIFRHRFIIFFLKKRNWITLGEASETTAQSHWTSGAYFGRQIIDLFVSFRFVSFFFFKFPH